MKKFLEKISGVFTRENALKIILVEVTILLLMLCLLLMMTAKVSISLNGDREMNIEAGSSFRDPGAKAFFKGKALDVKVTGEVDIDRPGTYTLCYRARYLLTTKKVYRTVNVVEGQEPTIGLIQGSSITVTMGNDFTDPGYTATDAVGNDLTAQVQVDGTVDTRTEGTYTLTYTVTDSNGRKTTVTRTVEVVPAKQPDVVDPDGKVIYLTFDDGPGKYTQRLLQILKKYNVKATFFVTDQFPAYADMMEQIVDDGHAIGIHTMSHDYATIYSSEQAYLDDLYGMQQIIYDRTGVKTTLMRFPGGASNTLSKKYCTGIMTALTAKVTELGFQYFDWNVDSGDGGGAKTAKEIYNNVISGIGSKKTAVVLMHDIHECSVDAVEDIILWGLENGYTFQGLTPESPICHHGVNN